MKLWCLHGNLQLPSVWDTFKTKWHAHNEPVSLICPNIWDHSTINFTTWTNTFNQQIPKTSEANYLMGYSLGGRLALHALISNPQIWHGAIIIGAHPGFSHQTERSAQLEKDSAWGKRFEHESWRDLIEEWDALPVFCGRPNPLSRPEALFSRSKVAAFFTHYSKGDQAFLTPALSKLKKPPILFISGEEDSKYTEIGRHLGDICPMVRHSVISNAGHRVPWENPEAFCQEVQVFLDDTSYTKRQSITNPTSK